MPKPMNYPPVTDRSVVVRKVGGIWQVYQRYATSRRGKARQITVHVSNHDSLLSAGLTIAHWLGEVDPITCPIGR